MCGLLIIGEWTRAEMRPAAEAASALASDMRIVRCRGVDEAVRIVTDDAWYPDLVLVCQSWPDEFPLSQIQELIAQLPLARWICSFGAWCESDGRNRSLWPAAPRVPARSAGPRIRAEFAATRGECRLLPLTAARDECFLFDYGRDWPAAPELAEQRIAVVSPDGEYRKWLSDLLQQAGAAIVPADRSPDFVLWDVDPWNAATAARLQMAAAECPSSMFLAIAGLAHPEDVMAIELSGASAVVAKLGPADELLDVLQTVVQRKAG